jgi:hypothetical protein
MMMLLEKMSCAFWLIFLPEVKMTSKFLSTGLAFQILIRSRISIKEPSNQLPKLRADLARLIAKAAELVPWEIADLSLLRGHYNNLDVAKSPSSAVVKNVIDSLEKRRWVIRSAYTWSAHLVFWLLLIFFYPISPRVRAIFFWNPWVRRIVGLGYIGLALTWIPFLQKKLLQPFKIAMLSDADLDSFDDNLYFDDIEIVSEHSREKSSLLETISEIKRQIVLIGDSGLGKSMFIRHMVLSSKRIVTYLPAERCSNGVIEAIQAKLHGIAKDPNFLRSLIYTGAMDICIDGLNAVDEYTHVLVTDFANNFPKANIIIATQPLPNWKRPSKAQSYILQPLRRDQMERFLFSRFGEFHTESSMSESTYIETCKKYLTVALDESQADELRASIQSILSNPMDLSLLAQMLALGQMPDIFHLQEQQYKIMAKNYEKAHHHQAFPLEAFSERVYQMRIDNESYLDDEQFHRELNYLERYKMVISRKFQWKTEKEWYFRHDKIMEFFIVQTFLGPKNERPEKLLNDPRFRGVYFLLANLMPLEHAEVLRETLIQYAADTNDHVVSDTFIKLMRSRKAR